MTTPRIVVFSSLFPSKQAPTAGPFIKERLFRLGKVVPIVVIAPQIWSPLDWLIRLRRKSFRPVADVYEKDQGIEIFRPRVFSFPGFFKSLDGWFMARGSRRCFDKVVKDFRPNIVDAHFLYPDGYAASTLARRAGLPYVVTIRGSKDEWLIGTDREPKLRETLHAASAVIAVSDALKRDVGIKLGLSDSDVQVVGNGVDLSKFHPVDKTEARARLGIAADAPVMIGVGGLIDRKGFHRIIPLVRALREKYPKLVYLIVGGGFSQGDMLARLKQLAEQCGVAENVRFCGPQLPQDLKWFYGAADIFTLATEHEGWANVFLEAMACGLPVLTTDVGGNSQVVAHAGLGKVSPYWDPEAYTQMLSEALSREWHRDEIIAYAKSNQWEDRIRVLEQIMHDVLRGKHA